MDIPEACKGKSGKELERCKLENSKYTEDKLLSNIKNEYHREKGWLTLKHIRSSTGTGKVRTADAISFSMWPSQGHDIIGFEIKTSYSDWKKELKNKRKANGISQYCDEWYVVAPKGVIRTNELPSKWGLKEPNGNGLKTIKKAERIGNGESPLPRDFITTIFRGLEGNQIPDERNFPSRKKKLEQ